MLASSGGREVWQAIIDLVKNLSETVLSALPNFWRIATSFMDGKLKKVRASLLLNVSLTNEKCSRQAQQVRVVAQHNVGQWRSR